MLSISSQAYTLPPLREDPAVLQNHPYQIQKFTDPSYLPKGQLPVVNVYWDTIGNIKAIFNVRIDFIGADVFRYAGFSLAQSILTEIEEYLANTPNNKNMLRGAKFAAQIGREWERMFQRPHGQVTIGILITLPPRLDYCGDWEAAGS